MSSPTENLRVRRTRKLLREALVDLIEERGFDQVTVGEITARAMVSRASFYRNYRDKYHLVEQIFDEAMAQVRGTVEADEQPPLERWVAFFEHLDAYHRMYGALLGRRGSPWFAQRMRAALADMVAPHFPPPENSVAPGLVPSVLSSVFAASITWWLEGGRPVPPREIATRSAQLAGAVIAEANGWRAGPPGR
ncbi:TetR/AcrR family transcriptional regulator [Streptomyces sp. NPDC020983]|uniref:TetR/AcrR family transcriptional regulator n=1 Tax=Streptomyces sp. NPDC020983 TaxID=3365106 RepID=UPI0037B3C323